MNQAGANMGNNQAEATTRISANREKPATEGEYEQTITYSESV